jgi:hypothetical protein
MEAPGRHHTPSNTDIADTVQFLGPAGPNTIATDHSDLAPSTAGSADDDIPF